MQAFEGPLPGKHSTLIGLNGLIRIPKLPCVPDDVTLVLTET